MRTGIRIESQVPNTVAEYDEREAARFSLIPWPDYLLLSRHERVKIVAYHEVAKLIEAHVEAARGEELRRMSGR